MDEKGEQMKKVFEIEYDESNSWQRHCTKQVIEWINLYKGRGLKITEIQPTNFCYAPMSVEYCECNNNETNNYTDDIGIKRCCIKTCNKPITSKPPIEKLNLNKWLDIERGQQTFNKFNEIIDWIETHNKEVKNGRTSNR